MLEPKDYTLPSGKVLSVNVASFKCGTQLGQAIIRCLMRAGIKLDRESLKSLSIASIVQDPNFVAALTQAALDAFTDDHIDETFWEMAKKCTYDGLRVTEELFNNSIDARQDFYQVKFLILKENILPFFPNLHTTLAAKQM